MLGAGNSPTGGRFYYKIPNNKASVFLIIGIVLAVINWIGCLICWVSCCFLALSQQATSLDFNDATGNIEVRKVGALTNGTKRLTTVPYARVVSAAMVSSGGNVDGQPGKVVILNLDDGKTVEVSPPEPQSTAETRCNLLNQHLAAAKSGSAPVQAAPVQPQYPQPVQPQQQYVMMTSAQPPHQQHAQPQQQWTQQPVEQQMYVQQQQQQQQPMIMVDPNQPQPAYAQPVEQQMYAPQPPTYQDQ